MNAFMQLLCYFIIFDLIVAGVYLVAMFIITTWEKHQVRKFEARVKAISEVQMDAMDELTKLIDEEGDDDNKS